VVDILGLGLNLNSWALCRYALVWSRRLPSEQVSSMACPRCRSSDPSVFRAFLPWYDL
jgi:hypothetical protein